MARTRSWHLDVTAGRRPSSPVRRTHNILSSAPSSRPRVSVSSPSLSLTVSLSLALSLSLSVSSLSLRLRFVAAVSLRSSTAYNVRPKSVLDAISLFASLPLFLPGDVMPARYTLWFYVCVSVRPSVCLSVTCRLKISSCKQLHTNLSH